VVSGPALKNIYEFFR
jgi:glucokinase